MIPGIHVLNSLTVHVNNDWIILIGIMISVFGGVLSAYGVLKMEEDNLKKFLPILILSILLTLGGFMVIAGAELWWHKTETRYEVTIDDSVSFNDFYDNYIILENRGEIFVITEKHKE